MSARFSRQDETRRIHFRVERNGELVTGLVTGVFTVTVVNPSGTANTTPSVLESTQKGGLYYFDVPSAFLTEVGEYGVVIEVNGMAPKITTTLALPFHVYQNDIDTITDGIWDELLSGHAVSGSAGEALATILRTLENRLEVDFSTQELILYADDGLTPLRRWPIETEGGEDVSTATGVQTKRKPSVI